MILVAVGTQFPFDRLVKAVDEWAGRSGRTDVLAQIGPSDYRPQNVEVRQFIAPDEFRALQEQASLLIAHCGMGSILSALEIGLPVLIMPRLHRLGEHRNDHQLATARKVVALPGVHIADDEADLAAKLDNLETITVGNRLSAKASPAFTAQLSEFIASGKK